MPPLYNQAMPGRVVSRRFIGREADLARVEAAIAGAAGGTATTILIAGSAGMGASRFLDQVLERTAGVSGEGRRSSVAAPTVPWTRPWAAVLEAVAPLLATRPDEELLALLRRDARPLLVGLPRMAALAAGMPEPARSELEDPDAGSRGALEALLRWLGRVAQERPIVLALEDLQVADAATRAFATFLSRTAREERLSLVLTWQPDRLTREHPLRENLAVIEAGLRAPVRVDLASLSRREIAALIEGIEGERPSASVVVLVAERSAGSPLVVEELIAARRELRHVSITGTLGDLIIARLARRSPESRRVLRLLAPSQRPMDRDRLARTATAFEAELAAANANAGGRAAPRSSTGPRRGADGLDADLAAGLAEALEHGFVIQEADERLRIRHELVARAVVTDLLPTQRPRYRAALARAFDDVPVVASHHWRTANRHAEAREAAFEAGPDRPRAPGAARRAHRDRDRARAARGPACARRPAGRRDTGRGARPGGRRGSGRAGRDRTARRRGRRGRRTTRSRGGVRRERAVGPRGAEGPAPARGHRGTPRPIPARGGRCPGRDGGPAQGGRRRPAGALGGAGMDPRAARPGADARRRVPRRGADRARGDRRGGNGRRGRPSPRRSMRSRRSRSRTATGTRPRRPSTCSARPSSARRHTA